MRKKHKQKSRLSASYFVSLSPDVSLDPLLQGLIYTIKGGLDEMCLV